MTSVIHSTKPRQRQLARFARLSREAAGDFLAIRQVFARRPDSFDVYKVEPIAADYGRGLVLHKPDGTSYCVNLSGPDSTCDCLGHLAHGHCKHVESLRALQARGQLEPSAVAVEEPVDEDERPYAGCHKCAGSGYCRDVHGNALYRCSCYGF